MKTVLCRNCGRGTSSTHLDGSFVRSVSPISPFGNFSSCLSRGSDSSCLPGQQEEAAAAAAAATTTTK